MKLKQIKCPNCNASIKLKDDKKEDIECEFCGSTFTYVPGKEEVELKKAEAERAKHTAEEYKAKKEYEESKNKNINGDPKIRKLFLIIFIIIALGGFLVFAITASSIIGFGSKQQESNTETIDKDFFNINFENITSMSNGFFVKKTLNHIINSNNKNKDHIIKVTYNDITTTKKEDIDNIISEIDDMKEYSVSLNYDDAGYVNEFIINER